MLVVEEDGSHFLAGLAAQAPGLQQMHGALRRSTASVRRSDGTQAHPALQICSLRNLSEAQICEHAEFEQFEMMQCSSRPGQPETSLSLFLASFAAVKI